MEPPSGASGSPANKYKASTDNAAADTSPESARPLSRKNKPRYTCGCHGCGNSAETHHTQTTVYTTRDNHRTHPHSPVHPKDQAREDAPDDAPPVNTAIRQYRSPSMQSPKP